MFYTIGMIGRLVLVAALVLVPCFAQTPRVGRVSIPPPMRVYIPFLAAWEGMQESLQELELEILKEDRVRGHLLTRYKEYSSGPLAESHIAKVGEKPQLWDGQWIRVEYQYDVLLELIEDREALVTVNANIRALQKPFLGGEKWVDIRSNGRLEADLLLNYGRRLFGQTFTLEATRKGFWQHEPGYVPEGELRPQITGPERRPPASAELRPTPLGRWASFAERGAR